MAPARSPASTPLLALDVAHVRPYTDGGAHALPNGLLMRADIHRLWAGPRRQYSLSC